MKRGLVRRAAFAFVVVLGAANVYFYNYAALLALSHPRSDIRFNLYGDPQIEGDAKLTREPRTGKYDLLINDYYLHHVYTATMAAFKPQYVVTMGDMFSSQWVNKEEYYKRIARLKWITDWSDAPPEFMFLAGNHDIGYGAETRQYHINRYTNNFGPLNYEWTVNNSSSTGRPVQFALLDAMHLDSTRETQYRESAWGFVLRLAARRALNPEIPFVLFLHIPLDKPGGVCTASPATVYKDAYVKYQDYLSPTTTAFLLHCLSPTLVFNGHDHEGCLAAHRVRRTLKQPATQFLHTSGDLCRMSLAELDAHQAEVEQFAQATLSTIKSSEIASNGASDMVIETTVRSAMGMYGGATGILDISLDSTKKNDQLWAFGRDFSWHSRGYQYRYRQVQLGNHLIVRALLITDVLAGIVVPGILLLF
ncbi:hypothetical protein LPJ79_001547 [Coemansia sp. RSA 1821]|nr:hypothetical protein LPJ79_001547 [Coemansia sp. RSA 1821]